MARMYSRRKGKSGSTKPNVLKKKVWVRYNAKELESLILKLAKSGKDATNIGLILRDSYGVSNVKLITKKSISVILKENKIEGEFPDDLMYLIKKEIKLLNHLELGKKDKTAKRGLQLTESKIKRLVKYYKGSGRLPSDWTYDQNKIKLLIS